MKDWYREHEHYLDRLVEENVYYNVHHLICTLVDHEPDNEAVINVCCGVDEDWVDDGGEPQYVEALSHYLVSDFLAEDLKKEGELVEDIHGLKVWGRQTYGQAISMDYVIQKVFKEMAEDRKQWHDSVELKEKV